MHANATIRPGQPWLDTSGNHIQAHGGSILAVADEYFWYGENKERSAPGSGIWHWGVRCYSSPDLVNWTDNGLILPPDLDDRCSPLHPEQFLDRPHIIYNEQTERFVCWIKLMGGAEQLAAVYAAEALEGPYELVRAPFRPLDMDAGDFDLVVEPDGSAKYIFERVHSELVIADLTDDYTDVTGKYTTHFQQPHPPFVREAPAHFRRNGRNFLVTSGTTGYYPNPSELAVADDLHGPWTVLGDPHPSDPTRTSFGCQISSVFRHPHKTDLYIALGDRWLPHYRDTSRAAIELFTEHFGPTGPGATAAMEELTTIDTREANYVWLPFQFDGEMGYLEWHDAWSIDDYV